MKETLEEFLNTRFVNTRNIDYQNVSIDVRTGIRTSYGFNDEDQKKSITLVDNPEINDEKIYADFILMNGYILWQIPIAGDKIDKSLLLKILCEIMDADKNEVNMQYLKTVMVPLFSECNFANELP